MEKLLYLWTLLSVFDRYANLAKTSNMSIEKIHLFVLETSGSEEDEVSYNKVSAAWWADELTPEDQFKLGTSGKLVLMAEILKMCEDIGDKL